MTDRNVSGIANELRDLASRAGRLPPPSHRKPEAFHEARDQLRADILAVVDKLEAR